MNRKRVAIWSVFEEDQRLYSWLFPSLWLAGVSYHAWLRFIALESPDGEFALTVSQFVMDIGIVGLSAAVMALMCIAARRVVMVLFDWPNKQKTREERDREWRIWLRKRDEALAKGEEFNEPPPDEKDKAA